MSSIDTMNADKANFSKVSQPSHTITPSSGTQPNGHSLDHFGNQISETTKRKISAILSEVQQLNDIEKLYLYLQLPDNSSNDAESASSDKKKATWQALGKKSDTEVIQTYTWIQSHFEEDISVSIPKHEVYEDYRAYCEANKFERLCVADFGKAMKHIFPQVKPRRLGQRGNSKYCYSGLRKRILVDSPELPALDTSDYKPHCDERDTVKGSLLEDIVWKVILEWVEKSFDRKFKSSLDFARFLLETQCVNLPKEHRFRGAVKHLIARTPTLKKKDICCQTSKKQIDKSTKAQTGVPDQAQCESNNAQLTNSISVSECDGNNRSIDNGHYSNINELTTTLKVEPDDSSVFCQPQLKIPSIISNSPASSTSAVILFPTSHAVSQDQSGISNQVCILSKQPSTIVSTVSNSSIIKYKPIQPKPLNLEQSLPYQFLGQQCNTHIVDKRRHSVSTPFSVDHFNAPKELEYVNIALAQAKLAEAGKRQMEDVISTKKRHASEASVANTSINCNSSILVSYLKCDKPLSSTMSNCDLKVNDLESEALFDYLNPSVGGNTNAFDSGNGHTGESTGYSTVSTSHAIEIQQQKPLTVHMMGSSSECQTTSAAISTDSTIDDSNGCISSLTNHCTDNSTLVSGSNSAVSQYHGNSMHNTLVDKMCSNLETISANCDGRIATIPPNLNACRRAYSFQPISPNDTPTIPENSALDLKAINQQGGIILNELSSSQMSSVVVDPSQPPSETSSPFVSPRNTPIPIGLMSRSRHNSGQSSAYSGNYQQTPNLPNFDSGVSSVSSSPFVSPQSTPIPGNFRMRQLENVTMTRNLARVRHSSGPGGPINRSQVPLNCYSRSNSMSPMIGDTGFVFSSQNMCLTSPKATTDLGEQNLFNQTLLHKLSAVSQTDRVVQEESFEFNSAIEGHSQPKPQSRQRHFSTPFACAPTMIKSEDCGDTLKMLLNRSHSVPLSEMFQSNMLNSAPTTASLSPFNEPIHSTNSIITFPQGLSKSYPATPICDASFKLPQPTSTTASASIDDTGFLTGQTSMQGLLTTANAMQGDSELMCNPEVSLNQGITSDSTGHANATSTVDAINASSPLLLEKANRNEYNDLLINDAVQVEHFPPPMDDFRDCDTNEFDADALELQTAADSYQEDLFNC